MGPLSPGSEILRASKSNFGDWQPPPLLYEYTSTSGVVATQKQLKAFFYEDLSGALSPVTAGCAELLGSTRETDA